MIPYYYRATKIALPTVTLYPAYVLEESMNPMPHLFVALSGHGLGHLAQTAPVLNALRAQLPPLRLTIQTSLSAETLHRRIDGNFQLIPQAADFGMIMANAMEVLAQKSLAAYRRFHADWDRHLTRQLALLEGYAPNLILTNIPYLPLAAARQLSIPALALCSLNWADILQGYCPDSKELKSLRHTMLEAYESAEVFLRPEPSMPMPELHNTRSIGPIADLGRARRTEVNDRLGLTGNEALVLVSLGGITMPLPMDRWPQLPNLCWLVPGAWDIQRSDARSREELADIPYVDLLRSSDALLTKPGYGSFTEAACNGIPVLYVERGDWPEEPYLTRWLQENATALRIDRSRLDTGNLQASLKDLLARALKPALEPAGIQEAVDCLRTYLLTY